MMHLQLFRRVRVSALLAGLLALGAKPAGAQDVPLANLLPQLILREIVLESPIVGLSHVAHFSPLEANEPNNPVVGIVQSFNSQMATQFSTFPLGSSTGGMTYVFDESLGTLRRGSGSFGPLFGERALTIGRRKLSVGFNYQRTSYDTFEGQDLDDGSIKFYLRHQDCCTFNLLPQPPYSEFFLRPDGSRLTPPFEGDLIEAALSLAAVTHTTAVFANYGITERWDIGLALPIVRVSLDASVQARVLRLVTNPPPEAALTPQQREAALNTHTFEINNPGATLTVRRSGRATGLGDLVLRSKYRLLGKSNGGVAAAVDLRLPTGDEKELLGTGGTQAKLLLVVSNEQGRFGYHMNTGYTAAGGSVPGSIAGLTATSVPDEVNFSGGVQFVASPRITVTGDVVGRTLRAAGRLDLAGKTFEHASIPPSLTSPQVAVESGFLTFPKTSVTLDEFTPRPGNLTLLLGTAGVKVNPFGNWLVSASVLFPLSRVGLRSRLTTVIGLDYAF